MDRPRDHDELLGNNVEHNGGETISIQVSKGQFWGGIVAILAAVGAFGLTMRGDVTALQRDSVQMRKDVDANKASHDKASDRWYEAGIRLARIETMLDTALKSTADRLTKLEAWRDGPQTRPEGSR